MERNIRCAAAAALALATLAGCASARLVVVEPGGGAVAIHRNEPASRAKALELIAQRCPGGYEIVREEEAVTGTEVTNESSTEIDKSFNEARTTQRLSTRTRTEWRISFRCK